MILVYTPGRVGTCSLKNRLKNSTSEPVIAMHNYIVNQSLDGLEDTNVDRANEKLDSIASVWWRGDQLKVVTAVRDPIQRALSAFCFFYSCYDVGSENLEDIKEYFLTSYNHDWALNWFDAQVKPFLEIDVYDEEFDGVVQHYQTPLASLFVVKFPHFNEAIPVIEGQWDMQIAPLAHMNHMGMKARESHIYQWLCGQKYPLNYVNSMLWHKHTQYFFNKQELQAMARRWME